MRIIFDCLSIRMESGRGYTMGKNETISEKITLLRKAAKEAPEDSFIQRKLGKELLQAGQPEEAVLAYRRAIELGFMEESCFIEFSAAEELIGNRMEADRVLKEAWEKMPESELIPLYLYSSRLSKSDYNGAESSMKKAMALHPENYDFCHGYVIALQRHKKMKAEEEFLASIKEKFSHEKRYIYDCAVFLLRNGQPQNALDLLKESSRVCDPNGHMYLTLLSKCYTALQDQENAEDTFKKIYTLQPESTTALSIAVLCIMRQAYEEAASYLQGVVDQPDSFEDYYAGKYLLAACYGQRDKQEGETAIKELLNEIDGELEENPQNVILLTYGAQCQLALGNQIKASEYEEKAQKYRKELEEAIDGIH